MSKKHRRIVYEAAFALKTAIDNDPVSRAAIHELIPENKVGRNQLLPIFRKITGHSFRRYQRQKRIEASSEMLLAGLPIKQVAIECRYSVHTGNFSRDFKLIFNLSPDEWLRNQPTINNVYE